LITEVPPPPEPPPAIIKYSTLLLRVLLGVNVKLPSVPPLLILKETIVYPFSFG
jgi:hypothetical protein